MNREEAKKRIERLRELINHHRYLYHVLDREEISPAALDSLKKELFDLEQEFPELITLDSPTQRVGGKPLDSFEKHEHKKMMISFDDAFSRQDMESWEKRNFKLLTEGEKKKVDYYCEPKLDGLAIELVYEKGVLKVGATRGDGRTGENVTQNIKTIESLPLKLRDEKDVIKELKKNDLGEIARFIEKNGLKEVVARGEAVITKKGFEKVNKEREKQGLPLYANPRNLAAGSIRQLDSQIVASRNLDADVYDLISDLGQKTHQEEHIILQALGFKTNNKHNKLCRNLDEVFDFYDVWKEKRDGLPYEIDGIVVSINDNEIFENLGVVGKSPRGAIALKFPLIEATTIVEDIEVQVGRTGAMTPVAILKPVEVNGATITRATLHNEKEIERLGLKIGDTVVVGRAGDVIPEIVRVFPELRTGREKKFKMPLFCPSCETRLVKSDKEVIWRCPNPNCFSRRSKYFSHFVSRGAFDIDGLGPKIIERLMDEGLVLDPADLFDLKSGDLVPLERFGEKSAEKIVEAIQKRKKVPYHKFLYALGIRNVGQKTAYDLAQRFRSVVILEKISLKDLEEVKDVGPIVARSIFDWFQNKENLAFLKRLKERGVWYEKSKRPQGKLRGLKFVITGTLKSLGREEAKEKIEEGGGEVSSSVSKGIDYLILGANPGSKYDKARQLGVKILKEKEFLKIL
ncbi:MAG: NAD-dependent DNA ligase LigA [Candidatus Pacebacteria bacterium]|nr:NAD-dependent DNA ligase LigA [Candidatus Paceibacterota bacterium]